jgi:Doubled CXXCH motif (Paired_CXXCH_1)
MEHARHVFRVLLVLVVVVAVVSIGRGFLAPKSYGDYGSYRGANVVEQARIREPRHGGAESCTSCHAKQAQARTEGGHKRVSCEVCHAPLVAHVEAGVVKAKMPVDRSYALCARCHRKTEGRPEKFPQVVLDQHVPVALEEGVCLSCHNPHSPKP